MAASASLNEFTPKVMPVLVHVDARGNVTDVSSSTELSPRFDRLLRQNLDEMIDRPAIEHGHPVSSQFVINLALNVTPRKEGDYFANFRYVSASPVPNGSWYWVKIDGHRLALANRSGLFRGAPDFEHRWTREQDQYQRQYQGNPQRSPMPAIQNAGRADSPTASPQGRGR
ncbi:MAG: hypothetical protein ABI870_09835 [Rhodanobacter sp.]